MAEDKPEESVPAPLGGTRAQALQRLQVGLFGLGATVLMIGLAQIFSNQARETEAGVVPEAAPTVVPTASPTPASDPLADAGVGPDLDDERSQTNTEPDGNARQAD